MPKPDDVHTPIAGIQGAHSFKSFEKLPARTVESSTYVYVSLLSGNNGASLSTRIPNLINLVSAIPAVPVHQRTPAARTFFLPSRSPACVFGPSNNKRIRCNKKYNEKFGAGSQRIQRKISSHDQKGGVEHGLISASIKDAGAVQTNDISSRVERSVDGAQVTFDRRPSSAAASAVICPFVPVESMPELVSRALHHFAQNALLDLAYAKPASFCSAIKTPVKSQSVFGCYTQESQVLSYRSLPESG